MMWKGLSFILDLSANLRTAWDRHLCLRVREILLKLLMQIFYGSRPTKGALPRDFYPG